MKWVKKLTANILVTLGFMLLIFPADIAIKRETNLDETDLNVVVGCLVWGLPASMLGIWLAGNTTRPKS